MGWKESLASGEGDSKAEDRGTHIGQGDQGPKEGGNDHTKHKQFPALGPDVGKLIQHTCDHCLQACKLRDTHKWSQGGFGTKLLPSRTENRKEGLGQLREQSIWS